MQNPNTRFRLCMSALVMACVSFAAPDVGADGAEVALASEVQVDQPGAAIAQLLAPDAAPAQLYRVENGIAIYDPATGQALRQFITQQPVTAWCHARDATWFVALEGGEVLSVNFLTDESRRVAKFDGEVYWLHADGDLVFPKLDRVVAEHHVEGFGTTRLLYLMNAAEHIQRVVSLEMPFESVHEDAWGRLWLLPKPGDRLAMLGYINIDAGTPQSISVPRMSDNNERVFGGIVEAPGDRLFVWGQKRIGSVARIDYLAELIPPVFDDAVWDDLQAFDNFRLQRIFSRDRLLHGDLTVVYDTEESAFRLTDAAEDQTWLLADGTRRWVEEIDWLEGFPNDQGLPPHVFGLQNDDILVRQAQSPRDDWRSKPAPPLPEDWPSGYVDRLLENHQARNGEADSDEPTDLMVALFFGDIIGEEDQPVHVCASCETDWILGLDNGQVVFFNDSAGRFQLLTEVEGFPQSIRVKQGRGWLAQELEIIYRPTDSQGDSLRYLTMTGRFPGRWQDWQAESDHALSVDAQPWASMRGQRLEILQTESGQTEVAWIQLPNGRQTKSITQEHDLRLNGLFLLPNGQAIGYGCTFGGEKPLLIYLTNSEHELAWSPTRSWMAEHDPLPAGEITHAIYIPEARRILMAADEKLWSTDPWFTDWRMESQTLPEGFAEGEEE